VARRQATKSLASFFKQLHIIEHNAWQPCLSIFLRPLPLTPTETIVQECGENYAYPC
jgi:hypothetical protein